MNRRSFLRSALLGAVAATGLARVSLKLEEEEPVLYGRSVMEMDGYLDAQKWANAIYRQQLDNLYMSINPVHRVA